jgi:hypothetical protein
MSLLNKEQFPVVYVQEISHFLCSASQPSVDSSFISSLYFDILQTHCTGMNLTHQGIEALKKSMYMIQWSTLFMVFLVNTEKYSNKMKLTHRLHHQIQEPAKDMTHTSSH